jgi:ABC-2 type transport system ATP-binding protein
MAILECKALSKHYGKVAALESVDLSIESGRVVGLLGPNGSGKTTFIKLVNGLLTPTAGEVRVGGNRPGPASKALVAYLPDRDYLADWMSVEQQIRFFADFYKDFDQEKAREMLARLGVDPAQKFKTLSKGTREKVQLTLVMSRKAQLYLLDEPIGGVDPATRDFILDTIIRNYNPEAAVIISTHLIADVEQVLDEVIFLKEGRVVLQDSTDNIREQQGMSVDRYFREVFKC